MPHLISRITLSAHNGATFHRLPSFSVRPFAGTSVNLGYPEPFLDDPDEPILYHGRVFTLAYTRSIEGSPHREAVYREKATHGTLSHWARARLEARYA